MNTNLCGGMFFFSEYGVRFLSIEHFCRNEQLNRWWSVMARERKTDITLHVFHSANPAEVKYALCYLSAYYGFNLERVHLHFLPDSSKVTEQIAGECSIYIPGPLEADERAVVGALKRYGLKVLWNDADIEEMIHFKEPFDPGNDRYFLRRAYDKGRLWYSIVEVDPNVVDRVHVGYGSKLYNAYVSFCGDAAIHVGRGSYISVNPRFFLDSPFYLGSFCQVSTDFTAITRRHAISNLSLGHLADGALGFFGEGHDLKGDVVIESDVWIGTRVMVLPGVTIGHGCVIGAGSVVTQDCQPYGIYAGNPARFIRFRFPEEKIQLLLESQWWTWPLSKIYEKRSVFMEKVDDLSVEEIRDLLR